MNKTVYPIPSLLPFLLSSITHPTPIYFHLPLCPFLPEHQYKLAYHHNQHFWKVRSNPPHPTPNSSSLPRIFTIHTVNSPLSIDLLLSPPKTTPLEPSLNHDNGHWLPHHCHARPLHPSLSLLSLNCNVCQSDQHKTKPPDHLAWANLVKGLRFIC